MPWKVSFSTIFGAKSGNSVQLRAAVLKSKFCTKFRNCGLLEGLLYQLPCIQDMGGRQFPSHVPSYVVIQGEVLSGQRDLWASTDQAYTLCTAMLVLYDTRIQGIGKWCKKQEKPVPNDISKLEMNLHDSCEYLLKPYWGDCGLEASVRNSVLITQKCYISDKINQSPETTCLERPHFYVQWGSLSWWILLYCTWHCISTAVFQADSAQHCIATANSASPWSMGMLFCNFTQA